MSDQGKIDMSGSLVEGGARLPAPPAGAPIDVSDIENAKTVEEAIAIALGGASVQWAGGTNGVFLEDRVRAIAEALGRRVSKRYKPSLLDLINFLEWLDTEELMRDPEFSSNQYKTATHEDLAKAYMEQKG
jgi:hypothetical protein